MTLIESLFQDNKLVKLTKYFVAILSECDNNYNRHFAENALTLFTFVAFEIDALVHGTLEFEGQESIHRGFISKQCGSYDKASNSKDSLTKLTLCCINNLNREVSLVSQLQFYN